LSIIVAWSRPPAVARPCIRIHYHRIDTKPDYLRFLDTQAPQKHASKDPAEEPHAPDRDGLEKTLHRMGGDHSVLGGLDCSCIPRIIPQPVKASQVQIGAIDEEAEDLVKDCLEGKSLTTLS